MFERIWNRLSEPWKLFLAIVASLQAILFGLTAPGTWQANREIREWEAEAVWLADYEQARIGALSHLFTLGWKERCEAHNDDDSFVPPEDCSPYLGWREVVRKNAQLFRLSAADGERLRAEVAGLLKAE